MNSTKQLGLSKDIQQDAQEMVRRAEYALGKAIRAGQDRGEIRTKADGGWPTHSEVLGSQGTEYSKPGPTDFASHSELAGKGLGIYAMVDDVPPDQFEEALSEARDEDNLSRANVVRKVQGVKSDKLAPADRLNAERVRLGTLPNVRQASIPVTTQLAGRWTRRSVRGMHWTPRSGNRRV